MTDPESITNRATTDPTSPYASVIVAAYNMAPALRFALASVLAQSESNFEVLVVGDGCTDESAEVVASFADSRLRWFNLDRNYGSQYAPNSFGLKRARGKCVAYLGQDDLWARDHLECCLRVIEDGADIAVAAAMLYGPEDTGIRALSGLFPAGEYSPRHHFVPSSMVHRTEIRHQVGYWRHPADSEIGTDYDFSVRCYRAGARIRPTEKLTVFKPPTSWRRDAYTIKDTRHIEEIFGRLQTDLDNFREEELVAFARSVVEDRLVRLEVPVPSNRRSDRESLDLYNQYQRFKGTRLRADASRLPLLGSSARIGPPASYSGFEWHAVEKHPSHGDYRWTGPGRRSNIRIPFDIAQDASLKLHILYCVHSDQVRNLKLFVNRAETETAMKETGDGTWTVAAVLKSPSLDQENVLTIEVDKVRRPFDVLGTEDRRWLGVAVNWVEVTPIEISEPTSASE